MADNRICELPNQEYDGQWRVPVDREDAVTGSIQLNTIAGRGIVGQIIAYAGINTPNGFLLCDGSEVSKSQYSALYDVIENSFGDASDPAKFKLPLLTDARYMQGSTTAGIQVAAGIPDLSGYVDITGAAIESATGAFEMQGSESGGDSVGSGGDKFAFTASKGQTDSAGQVVTDQSKIVYGKSETVTPKSVTVRYLICYK
jgi:microcystin-dependent protein